MAKERTQTTNISLNNYQGKSFAGLLEASGTLFFKESASFPIEF